MSSEGPKVAWRAEAFAVVRVPLLSASTFLALAGETTATSFEPEAFEASRRAIRARVDDLLKDPVVLEAIYVASPSLYASIARWRANPESKEAAKIEQALVRYIGRMSTRATPFGLFAGFGVVTRSKNTLLQGLGPSVSRRNVRLDMGYLVSLAEALEADPTLRDVLLLRPNASLYEVAGRYHLPVLRRDRDVRHYELVGVDVDEPLRKILRIAEQGKTRPTLAKALCDEDNTESDALEYVDALLGARVLESQIEPALTGGSALDALIEQLTRAAPDHGAVRTLVQTRDALNALSRAPLGALPEAYVESTRPLDTLPLRSEHRFQVDLSVGAQATLGEEELRETMRGIELLRALAPQQDAFAEFRRAYLERYEQREMPLLEVLDDEVGIGYLDEESFAQEPAPLLAGLGLRTRLVKPRLPPDTMQRDALLLRKLEAAWQNRQSSIELHEHDFAQFDRHHIPPLPDSFAALISLHRLKPGELSVFLQHFSGPSAARLLGRFTPWSASLTEHVRAHLRREEALRPEAVFAEIVHMPDIGRAANVLFRPVLREHEIAYCGRSGTAPTSLIPVSDLWVSVEGSRIVLRSRRLGREVVPRLASAHNFAGRQMTVYRFLANLQQQGVTPFGSFQWGPFARARTLPRVTSGRLILAPQRFTLSAQEIAAIVKGTPLERMRILHQMQREREMPRYVGFEDGDNVLAIDLENSLTVDAFAGAIKGRKEAALVELFLEPQSLVGIGEGGKFASEFVVPFVRSVEGDARVKANAAQAMPTFRLQREHMPGSEWLYFKVYCARGSVDGLLRDVVGSVIHACKPYFRQWFFIRYDDPRSHVRLRFLGDPEVLLAEVLPRVRAAFAPHIATGRVQTLEVATYVRELERYGGDDTMEWVEQAFAIDSQAALRLLMLLEGVPEGRERWGFTLLGAHMMLADFGFAPEVRDGLIDSIRLAFREEMAFDATREHHLFERYREDAPYVEGLLTGSGVPAPVIEILRARSQHLRPIAQKLRALRREQRSQVTSESLVASLLHMWCNRMLRTEARAHEFVIYTYLWKYYRSQTARAAQQGKT